MIQQGMIENRARARERGSGRRQEQGLGGGGVEMGLFVPSSAKGRNLDAIFAEKVPKLNPKIKYYENEKWLVGT